MPWNDSLSVKVAQFDNEHKKLIGLVDELMEAMRQGKGRDLISRTIHQLVDYTNTHFKAEERAMQQFGYPGYGVQKAQHDEFVSKVTELQEDYDKGNPSITITALNYLTNWVTNHIKKVDSEYGAFFNEKGLR
jgi:hemerythrin